MAGFQEYNSPQPAARGLVAAVVFKKEPELESREARLSVHSYRVEPPELCA